MNKLIQSNDFQSINNTSTVTEGAPCRTDWSDLLTRETIDQILDPADYSHTLQN